MAAPATRFAINGAKGRMGQAVARVLDETKQTVVAKFGRADMADLTRADAVIDFSTPEASLALLSACAQEPPAVPEAPRTQNLNAAFRTFARRQRPLWTK